MTNIALYSDQPILGEGLRNVVGSIEGFALSAIYPSPDLMIDHIRRTECPDLLLVEVTPAMTLGALNQVRSVAPAAATLSETASIRLSHAEHVKVQGMKKNVWRAVTEIGFIIFLFYSNLLMGEFTRSGMERGRGLAWAIEDIFTEVTFAIAVIAALIGYLVFEFLRKRLDLSPKLRQTVKTHFSLNGELSHGSSTTEVHEGI